MTEVATLMVFIWFIGWWFTTGVVVPTKLTLRNAVWFTALVFTWPIKLGEWVAEKSADYEKI